MSIDKELLKGSTSMMVLKSISKVDLYGYLIIKELSKSSGDVFNLKEGTLYPILHALEGKGYIESYWNEEQALRRRKYYHITSSGKKHLTEKQIEWELFTTSVNRVLRRAQYEF